MADGTVVLSVVFEAVAGREQELASKLAELVEPTRKESGCLRYELNASTEKPGTFLFFESFAGPAALDAHVGSAHFQKFLKYREESDPVASQIVTRWTPLA